MRRRAFARGIEGSFTVFFSMIFLTVVLCYLGLLALTNHMITVSQGRRTVESAAKSTLAEYDRYIEQKYGLYCVKGSTHLQQSLEFYLEENMYDGGNGIFPCQLQEMSVTTGGNLGNKEVLEAQINQFMKARFWIATAEELITGLEILEKAEDAISQLEKTMEEWELLDQYNSKYQEAVQLMEGVDKDGKKSNRGLNYFYTEWITEEKTETVLFMLKEKNKVGFRQEIGKILTEIICAINKAQSAANLLEELQELAGQITSQELPLNKGDLQKYQRTLRKNISLLETAEEILQQWETGWKTEEGLKEIKKVLEGLQGFETISFVYEIKQGKRLDWKGLWNELLGKDVSIKDYVEDVTLLDKKDSVYRNLPSKRHSFPLKEKESGKTFWKEICEGLNDVVKEIYTKAHLLEYTTGMFSSFRDTVVKAEGGTVYNLRRQEKQSGFFENEAEYLFNGSFNEYDNVKVTYDRIILLRTILNIVSILNDVERNEAIRTVSSVGEVVAPGVGEVVVYVSVLVLWSYWEAQEDWEALVAGDTVPLLKRGRDWKTDLINIESQDGGKENGIGSALRELSYQQYMKLLLCFVSTEKLERRIQDMIYLETSGIVSPEQYITAYMVEGKMMSAGQSYYFSGKYGY